MVAPTPRRVWTVGTAGAAAGLAAAAALVWGGYPVPVDSLVPAVLLNVAVGWSFIGIGLVAWHRRPASRAGLLMAAVGFAWLVRVAGAVHDPAAFVVGAVTKTLYLGVLVHLLVTYPTGRATGWRQRLLVGLGYLVTAPTGLIYLLLVAGAGGCWNCPVNIVVIRPVTDPEAVARAAGSLVIALLLIVVLTVLVLRAAAEPVAAGRWPAPPRARPGGVGRRGHRLRDTGPVRRRPARPHRPRHRPSWPGRPTSSWWAGRCALLLGLLRSRLDRAAVGDLIVGLGERDGAGTTDPRRLQRAVAHALHDPAAELALWQPQRQAFVDPSGEPVRVDQPGDGRVVAPVEHDGERIAVIVHADALTTEPELVDAVVASAALVIENQRLHAAARARLAEVRASRRRIVEAADAERRRIERDLHDGAQQRLLSVALAIRLIRVQLPGASAEELAELVAEASAELATGIEELRELARGVYPAALADGGLGAALGSLAERSPVPVTITAVPGVRLPEAVEHACYFTVSELLANAAKHAGATHVDLDVRLTGGSLVLQVRDDGTGGADPAGSGLRGLADRVASPGGLLTVHSPAGAGTRAVATFPLDHRVVRVAQDPDAG